MKLLIVEDNLAYAQCQNLVASAFLLECCGIGEHYQADGQPLKNMRRRPAAMRFAPKDGTTYGRSTCIPVMSHSGQLYRPLIPAAGQNWDDPGGSGGRQPAAELQTSAGRPRPATAGFAEQQGFE